MNVLVIGNGFDLDLGLKTKYFDFVQSGMWDSFYSSFNKDSDDLSSYLYKLAEEDSRWFDIENGITKYVQEKESKQDFSKVEEDHYFFDVLLDNFGAYLFGLVLDNINKESPAYRMSEIFNKSGFFDVIYSFNHLLYNDSIEVELGQDPVFVHNNLWDPVLGIAEDGCKSREYSFLKKVNHQPPLQSTNMLSDLKKADEVVIYGHSVNAIDKVYFEDFFRQASEETGRIPKKRVTIVTHNSESICSISENIADMGVSVTRLRNTCNLVFIATHAPFDTDNAKYLASLMERLKNGHNNSDEKTNNK